MTQSLFSGPAGLAVRVALPVPADEPFDYAVPDDLRDAARPGCRAVVPFGSRTLTGVIVERGAAASARPLKGLRAIVDPEPVLSDAMLSILREEAAAVLCPIGLALQAAHLGLKLGHKVVHPCDVLLGLLEPFERVFALDKVAPDGGGLFK